MRIAWYMLTIGCILCGVAGHLLTFTPAWAQRESCVVAVHYGDSGTDRGDCSNGTTGLCASYDYALDQGLQVCQSRVQMFHNGIWVDTYTAPLQIHRTVLDWLLVILYWLVPMIVGGLVGWYLGASRRVALGGAA
ncbi:MAG: hypothetical protein KDE19_09560 [Caldilineaceae bacterium]|nr:hypothetical protein [Caldilineaceae bacterium]